MKDKNQPWSAFVIKVQVAEVAEVAEPSDLLLISGKCTNLSLFSMGYFTIIKIKQPDIFI